MLLSKEQRLAASVLFSIALITWLVASVWPTHPDNPNTAPKKRYRTWEERKDSMRQADSVRYAEWAAQREQRYDSFRLADSIRRNEWKRIRQEQYDSFRRADSLWRDSVGWRYTRHIKKDTVLDLNHCDTTELQLIRGIGPSTAARIVRYREALGGYYSPNQLTDEPFDALALDTLLHRFTADSNDIQPIDVNSCSVDRLRHHPYLRYTQAKAIYTLRRRLVHLTSIDELQTLPELTPQDLQRLTPYLCFD